MTLYPTISLEKWCEIHGIEVVEKRCSCRKIVRTTIPFADKYGFGLESPRCPCKNGIQVNTVKLRPGAFSNITDAASLAIDPPKKETKLKLVPKNT